jgi:hypothetical protein
LYRPPYGPYLELETGAVAFGTVVANPSLENPILEDSH